MKTTSEIRLFKSNDATHSVAAGGYVFRAGDAGDCAFVVLEGSLEILVDEVAVEHAEAGGLIGEMALVEQKPRSASARAITDCKLVAIDQRRFLFLIQQTPFFAQQVMQIMAERLRTMNRTLARTIATPE